jgi:hypothetical protein
MAELDNIFREVHPKYDIIIWSYLTLYQNYFVLVAILMYPCIELVVTVN